MIRKVNRKKRKKGKKIGGVGGDVTNKSRVSPNTRRAAELKPLTPLSSPLELDSAEFTRLNCRQPLASFAVRNERSILNVWSTFLN